MFLDLSKLGKAHDELNDAVGGMCDMLIRLTQANMAVSEEILRLQVLAGGEGARGLAALGEGHEEVFRDIVRLADGAENLSGDALSRRALEISELEQRIPQEWKDRMMRRNDPWRS